MPPKPPAAAAAARVDAVAEALGVRAEYMPTYSETDKYAYQFGVYTGIVVNMPVGVFMVPLLLALVAALAAANVRRSPFVSLALRDFLPAWPFLQDAAGAGAVPALCGPNDYDNDQIVFGRRGVLCPPFRAL